MASAGNLSVMTRTMAAADVITISNTSSTSYISVLCLTDNDGANGITILGTGSVGATGSNAITLTANQSITISAPDPYQLGSLTITAGASSTATVIAV